MRKTQLAVLICFLGMPTWCDLSPVSIESPDGRIAVKVESKDSGETKGCLYYSVSYDGKELLQPSRLGLALEGGGDLDSGLQIVDVSRTKWDREYSPVYGERQIIPDTGNEMMVEMDQKRGKQRRFFVQFRAYNEGVAFRYVLPEQAGMKACTISSEHTEFSFSEGDEGYEEHGTEGVIHRVPIRAIKPKCEMPLTVDLERGPFVSVMEAHLENYPRAWLSPAGENTDSVHIHLGSSAEVRMPFETPWRVLLIGKRPGDLIEQNYLILNLNPPCAIDDTNWIKPGTVIRVTALTTEYGKKYTDFAAEHKIDYIEFDAGWYDAEWEETSDARTPKEDLDIQSVIEYAKERGIGVILYVNRNALMKQLDEILPLYEEWGVKGIKMGFVKVGSQEATRWLHDAVRQAARHHLMVDIHDSYRPTGFSRTYPNLMTQEGVRGNEHMPVSEHNVTLPFTRLVSGAADCTMCYYSDRIKNTHAHQLATSVVFYSPLQFLFWYDRPSEYQGEPEIEFWHDLPTVWDETKVLHGRIGDSITVGRRSGEQWYVASLTDENPREILVELSFLDPEREYVVDIYSDGGEDVATRTQVRVDRRPVTSKTRITASLAANGGHSMRICPKCSDE